MPKTSIHPYRNGAPLREKNWSKGWKKWSKLSRGCIGWRLLKGIIFIICLTLFFYQSAKFLPVYYKYPTTTKIELTYPNEFEFPAVTFCNNNPVKRTKFCAEYPDLCERPSNITEACEIEPSACKDNPSNLDIPKFDKFGLVNRSRDEVVRGILEVYYSGNATTEFWEEWAWSIESYSEMKAAFVPRRGMYYSCFAENLLLNCTDEPEKINLDSRYMTRLIRHYVLNLERSEEILFGMEPSVFISVHSPFVPVNPFYQGNPLKLGHKYNIYIKLEEENLLPFPYVTNCTIYEDTWNEGNRHRPRSQQMCQELCLHSLFEPYKNMTPEFEILEHPIEVCLDWFTCMTSSEDRKILELCRGNCKPSCRNLKYTSTIDETVLDVPKHIEIRDSDYGRDKIQVQIFLGDRQVIVERHFPLYDTGYLFSYIGGLMGCWLGISIWAFAGIAENVFRRALQWMGRIKRYLKKTSRTPHAVFTSHQNVLNVKIS